MAYKVRHVANSFLHKDFEDGRATITPLKMQKLIYFLHGLHLARIAAPAIDSEFRAWQYGPVEETLYHSLKQYRGSPITAYIQEPNEPASYVVPKSDVKFYEILDEVWRNYGQLSALQLSAMTHERGSPWDTIYNYTIGSPSIPDGLIQDYFKTTKEKNHVWL